MSGHTQGTVYAVSTLEIEPGRPASKTHGVYSGEDIEDPYAHIAECGNADNARRIVAAWNACQGIPTEVLEAQQSGGLPRSVADQIEARVVQADLVGALNDAVSTLFMRIEERHGAKVASEYPEVVRGRAAIARAGLDTSTRTRGQAGKRSGSCV